MEVFEVGVLAETFNLVFRWQDSRLSHGKTKNLHLFLSYFYLLGFKDDPLLVTEFEVPDTLKKALLDTGAPDQSVINAPPPGWFIPAWSFCLVGEALED